MSRPHIAILVTDLPGERDRGVIRERLAREANGYDVTVSGPRGDKNVRVRPGSRGHPAVDGRPRIPAQDRGSGDRRAGGTSVTSVVIAAHNEEAVIGRCLDALLADARPAPLDITVVANGCTDATAAVAGARAGVRVINVAEAGKPGALNAGDAVAVGFPRVYLDADIVLSRGALDALVTALAEPVAGGSAPPLAVVPGRTLDVAGRPVLVRAFYAVNSRLPAFRHSLFGRGAIALSAAGRARFDTFPAMTADDLFLDSLFEPHEKREADGATSHVATPRRTGDLVRRLVRVRAGNAAMRAAAARGAVTTAVRGSARSSWLRDVVLPRPWLAPAAACYVGISLVAALLARRQARAGGGGWGRDESSRRQTLASMAETDG
jgi:hypothetical protein